MTAPNRQAAAGITNESLLHGLGLNTPNRGARLSLVDNTLGNHIDAVRAPRTG
jgi:hypothetical protein